MPIVVRHAPRGITDARARALYGAKRGAEQPWWDRFGASLRTAAQMYEGRRRQERGIQAQRQRDVRMEDRWEDRMRLGAGLREEGAEAAFGRRKEMVEFAGEEAVGRIGAVAQAQRAQKEKQIIQDRQKLEQAVDAGQFTPEEAQPFLDNLNRAEAGMPPKPTPPSVQEMMKTRVTTDELGRTFLLQPDGKITITQPPKPGEAKLEPWRPGQRRNEDVLRDAMKDVQQDISREKMAAEDGYTAPLMAEQDRRVEERYDQIVRLRLGLEAPPPPPTARPRIGFEDVDAVTGATRLGGPPVAGPEPTPAAGPAPAGPAAEREPFFDWGLIGRARAASARAIRGEGVLPETQAAAPQRQYQRQVAQVSTLVSELEEAKGRGDVTKVAQLQLEIQRRLAELRSQGDQG